MTPHFATFSALALSFSQSSLFSSLLQPLLTTRGSCSIFLPGTYLSSSISHFHRRETHDKTALQTERGFLGWNPPKGGLSLGEETFLVWGQGVKGYL